MFNSLIKCPLFTEQITTFQTVPLITSLGKVAAYLFLKSLVILLSIVFKGFVIQSGSRGTILLISFIMKFDIIFKKVIVNVLTYQLGSWLILRC